MRSSPRQQFLTLIGGLFTAAGFLAWAHLAWSAISNLDEVTPRSSEGGRLMFWALAGTILMVIGMVILNGAEDAAE